MKTLIDKDFIKAVAEEAIGRKLSKKEHEEVYDIVFENLMEFVYQHAVDIINQ